MNYTHWRVDARLVRAYIDKSVDTMEWVEKMGIEFEEPRSHNPGLNYTWVTIKGPPGPPPDPREPQRQPMRGRCSGEL